MSTGSDNALTLVEGVQIARAWQGAKLPQTWPDRLGFRLFLQLLKAPFVKGGEVHVPAELPGPEVPLYAREPFHGLPNGYYSHSVAGGYDTGFEVSMLGRVAKARMRMVEATLEHHEGPVRQAMDLGCGSGRLAQSFANEGVGEVWGLDPSPYLLQIAQNRTNGAQFVQGIAESAPFGDASFDAIGACFLFHELPRDAAVRSIREIHRLMRPGGVLTITDPCRDHVAPSSLMRLTWKHGLKAFYFHFLARGVYEPFLDDWHGIGDHSAWLRSHGFEVISDHVEIPFKYLVARKL